MNTTFKGKFAPFNYIKGRTRSSAQNNVPRKQKQSPHSLTPSHAPLFPGMLNRVMDGMGAGREREREKARAREIERGQLSERDSKQRA